jgi:hypothetical protein
LFPLSNLDVPARDPQADRRFVNVRLVHEYVDVADRLSQNRVADSAGGDMGFRRVLLQDGKNAVEVVYFKHGILLTLLPEPPARIQSFGFELFI